MPYPTPEFRCRFQTAMFDCDYTQGIAVSVDGKRRAVRIDCNSTPQQVAQALRTLADWIESQSSN